MADEPRIPSPKGALNKFKGLPPWAYAAAIGVGGFAIWYGITRSRDAAASEAEYATGDYSSALSATSAGEAYPVGSQGAGYVYDPGTGAVEGEKGFSITDFADLLSVIGYTGGGSQPSANPADHYTPPTINVNIPPEAFAPAPAQPTAPPAPAKGATSGPAKDPCVGEYPFLQDNGTRAGKCYKIVLKDGKRYKFYKNGDKIPA